MLLVLAAVAVCAKCHPAVVRGFLASPMGRSAGLVDPAQEQPGEFSHSASGLRFRIQRAGSILEMKAGDARANLRFYIGSGQRGRSYAESEQGFLYQVPVGFYTGRGWDMAPGYQNDRKPDLGRPVTRECLYCHSSGARFDEHTLNRVLNQEELGGIGCERCHGDGTAHSARPRRDNIVNPSVLPAPERDSVCEQCHLSGESRIPLPGKQLDDFRPGDRFSAVADVFVSVNDRTGVTVNSHAEALSRSRCRIASGGALWCGNCHSIHRADASYRAACLTCHAQGACPVPASRTGDCIECHMPKVQTVNGNHEVLTDHSIPRRSQTPEGSGTILELRRFYNDPREPAIADRGFGLSYAELADRTGSAHWRDLAWSFLRRAVQGLPSEPRLLTETGSMLQQTGRGRDAELCYRRSLELDPWQNAALVNLAGLLATEGDKAEAIRLLRRALAVSPRQPQVSKEIEFLQRH